MPSPEKQPTTWRQIEAFVDTGRGSYSDARDHFGVTPDEVELEPDDYKLINKSPETVQTKKPNLPGVCVDLGERALLLSNALDYYMTVRKLGGLIHKKEKKDDFEYIFQTVEKKNQSEREGDLAFFMAFGGYEMTKAGHSIHKVDVSAQEDADRFLAEYSGSSNSNKRAKSRKVWKEQIERVRQTKEEIRRKEELGE